MTVGIHRGASGEMKLVGHDHQGVFKGKGEEGAQDYLWNIILAISS